MKLTKSETEKLVLGGALCAGLLFAYFSLLLGPLNTKEKRALLTISETQPKIAEAKAQVDKTEALEKKAPESRKTLEQIKSLIPAGAPVAWFPPRMQDFFKKKGVEKTSMRISGEVVEKDLPGFRRITWFVDVPKIGFPALGAAVADLENNEPLLEITNMQIEAIKDDPEFSHVTLTVATIVTQ